MWNFYELLGFFNISVRIYTEMKVFSDNNNNFSRLIFDKTGRVMCFPVITWLKRLRKKISYEFFSKIFLKLGFILLHQAVLVLFLRIAD